MERRHLLPVRTLSPSCPSRSSRCPRVAPGSPGWCPRPLLSSGPRPSRTLSFSRARPARRTPIPVSRFRIFTWRTPHGLGTGGRVGESGVAGAGPAGRSPGPSPVCDRPRLSPQPTPAEPEAGSRLDLPVTRTNSSALRACVFIYSESGFFHGMAKGS